MKRNALILLTLAGTFFCSLTPVQAQSEEDSLPWPSMVLELVLTDVDTGRELSRPRMSLIHSFTATIETEATFAELRTRIAWSVTAEFEDENVCITVVYEDLRAEEFCGTADKFQFQTTLELGDVGDVILSGRSIVTAE